MRPAFAKANIEPKARLADVAAAVRGEDVVAGSYREMPRHR